jgi:hypothetical protein
MASSLLQLLAGSAVAAAVLVSCIVSWVSALQHGMQAIKGF